MPQALSTQLNRIAEMARRHPNFQFGTLAHLINAEAMEKAFRSLQKNAAAGVDGVTAEEYGKDLNTNLTNLHERMKQGRYRAQPLRRVYIEKEDGKQRPLSIPALEDKIAQKAVTSILEQIYEADFLPCSFGYRPGRGAHDALDAIQRSLVFGGFNYVLDADIKNYFGTIVRNELMQMLQRRVTDKDLLQLIGKWINCGVVDDGQFLMDENGVYQGSVISPILANVYLHEVLDAWIERDVKPRMRGTIALFRYADDILLCFQHLEDAERVHDVLIKRLARFGLELSPEKTKLIEFGPKALLQAEQQGKGTETFNFLGFTHVCSRTRKGKFTVKVRTMSKRLGRALKKVGAWCRDNRHWSVKDQCSHLCLVLRGHYNYYGRISNFRALNKFYGGVKRLWHKWLSRRHRGNSMPWDTYISLLKRYPLLTPYIVKKW
jgi:RNA-directed DNA polymerase